MVWGMQIRFELSPSNSQMQLSAELKETIAEYFESHPNQLKSLLHSNGEPAFSQPSLPLRLVPR